MSGSEADAAYASACSTTAVLLRRSCAQAGNSTAAAVRAGLLEMYQAVAAGNALPAAVLTLLLAQLREAAAGCSSSSRSMAELPAEAIGGHSPVQAAGQVVSSSSNKRQHVAPVAASSSKKPRQPALQQRDPPPGADKRPGLWVKGGFCVQLGDTIIQ
jgi:hypothetical protein